MGFAGRKQIRLEPDKPMRDIAVSLANADADAVAGTIEQARLSIDAVQQQHVELRLVIMQTRIRIAEVKATLRRFENYLPAGLI